MKFLAFLIVIFVGFWFLFSPKPAVVNEEGFNDEDEYSEYDRDRESQRKKLAYMDTRDLNNEVNSGLAKIDNVFDKFTTKTKEIAAPVLKNENVQQLLRGFNVRWQNFKVWVSNLPLIKQYRKSIYSDENWRKEMDATDFSRYVGKNSTGAHMLQEGTEKWKKL